MTSFYPQTGSLEEWNAAYYRLEDYLRAHHVSNKLHQSQIILRLLQRASAKHARCPDQTPTQLALEEAYRVMDHWFQRLLPDESEARAPVVGRVSLYILDATETWPNLFLAPEEEIPPDFREALRETRIQSGPDLRVSSMVPRPLDAGLADEGGPVETWDRVGRMSVALLIGMLGLGAGAVYFYFK
jgi:hypothetical protein